jgi:CBS domain-containing protein
MVRYGIRVREIMTRRPITITPESSIAVAAKLMRKNHVGGLIVIDKGRLAGVITEGDILGRAFIKNKSPTRTKVGQIMTRDVTTVHPDVDLYNVTQLMNSKGMRRLPVVEDGQVVGYVTEKDLLKVEPGIMDVLIEKLKVKDPTMKLTYTLRR